LIKIKGTVIGLRETEKGSKILLLADEKAVHNVLVAKDFVWQDQMKGKEIEVSGLSNDGLFMFADREAKK